MSSRLIVGRHYTDDTVASVTSASNQVLIGPIDVGHYESFSFLYQNSASTVAFLDLKVEASPTADASQAGIAEEWVQIPTATLAQPSALAATASVLTGPVDNAYKYIRVLGRTVSATTQKLLTVTIVGHKAE